MRKYNLAKNKFIIVGVILITLISMLVFVLIQLNQTKNYKYSWEEALPKIVENRKAQDKFSNDQSNREPKVYVYYEILRDEYTETTLHIATRNKIQWNKNAASRL